MSDDRSAVPTRDEMIDALNQSIVEQGYGDTDIDPGDLLEALLGITGVLPVAAPTREQVREAIRSANPFTGLEQQVDAVVALLSRPAAEPPPEVDVLRGLLDHAVQSWSPRGTGRAPIFAEWEDLDWADSGWTEAERVELRAAVEHDRGAQADPPRCERCRGYGAVDILSTSEMSAEALDSGALIEGKRCPDCNGSGVAAEPKEEHGDG